MKQLSVFVFAAMSLGSTLAHAQAYAPARIRDRMPTLQQVCSYDEKCTKITKRQNRESIVKPPSAAQIAYYTSLRTQIIQIANQYGIDPVTLVLTPMAENTMNVGYDDRLIDALADQGKMDDDGRITGPEGMIFQGHMFSVGPGQIYVHAARGVEPLAAQIEGRAIRPKREIKAALLTSIGALRYAAAIIRDAQDRYAAAGKPIADRPEILSTLYNIGQVDRRLRSSQGNAPRPNYFGWWVGYQYENVKALLNL